MGALQFIVERNPETATAGGILGSVLSVSSIVGPIVGGILAIGDVYVYPMYAAAVMCGIALLTYWIQLRLAPVPGRAPAARSGD